MKKRGRKVLLVSVAAVVVALIVCALVFREQPPYEFLRGMERVRTTIETNAATHAAYSVTTYVSERSPYEVSERARKELEPLEWSSYDIVMRVRGIDEEVRIGEFPRNTASGRHLWDDRLVGKTYISASRPARAIDRFNAWLDDRLGR